MTRRARRLPKPPRMPRAITGQSLARAAFTDDLAEAEEYYRLAEEAGKLIAEDDNRELLERDLPAPPWLGYK